MVCGGASPSGLPGAAPDRPGRPCGPVGSILTSPTAEGSGFFNSSLRGSPQGYQRISKPRKPLDSLVSYFYICLDIFRTIGGGACYLFRIESVHVHVQDENTFQQRLRLLPVIPGRSGREAPAWLFRRLGLIVHRLLYLRRRSRLPLSRYTTLFLCTLLLRAHDTFLFRALLIRGL